MATLVRRLLKVLFFIGLFILAVKYIHSYPYPMPESQLQHWFSISEFLGFSNPEDIYFPAMLVLDIIVASLAYVFIMKGFYKFRTRKKTSHAG
ncbi:hypothetical protein [Yersinia similis]|uniref:Membrane protein n=1 Tax=Yersinia similis TaxID=367190 RepID=A0A0T9RBE1_9GAMM|nr:hypothetical protein [Yersinia similis]AHK18685.1 membrane protein [Yersinia similis]CFQ68700.1 Uncharacterised protein [Yersinia similis]CNB83851.1 Uncharacterised protein [Yersinia similis]CNF35823.1 Uncharacterised protein [Yersinia similis]CNG38045.1 Uncharacterised protein [Yersinia similis]